MQKLLVEKELAEASFSRLEAEKEALVKSFDTLKAEKELADASHSKSLAELKQQHLTEQNTLQSQHMIELETLRLQCDEQLNENLKKMAEIQQAADTVQRAAGEEKQDLFNKVRWVPRFFFILSKIMD
jgi:hypothetical protein